MFNDDPVRPHLTEEFRLSNNRLGLALIDNHNCKAAVCIAISNEVPTNEIELDEFSSDKTNFEKSIAIFYTIWSYDKGCGRKMLFNAVDWLQKNRPEIKRFVTLSPKNNMARNFHLKNGAKELSVNSDSLNISLQSASFQSKEVGNLKNASLKLNKVHDNLYVDGLDIIHNKYLIV